MDFGERMLFSIRGDAGAAPLHTRSQESLQYLSRKCNAVRGLPLTPSQRSELLKIWKEVKFHLRNVAEANDGGKPILLGPQGIPSNESFGHMRARKRVKIRRAFLPGSKGPTS